jgi:hypothetical protein
MDRFKIILGRKSKEIKSEKKDLLKRVDQSHFTRINVMLDYMSEREGIWEPVEDFYFEEIPLIAYRIGNEIATIKLDDYYKTNNLITETVRNTIDQKKDLYLS